MRLAVQPGELGDEQLHRLADLAAQGARDLRLLVLGAGEQRGQAACAVWAIRWRQHPRGGEQRGERAQQEGLLLPQVGVEHRGARRPAGARVHERPEPAVGQQRQRNARVAADLGDLVGVELTAIHVQPHGPAARVRAERHLVGPQRAGDVHIGHCGVPQHRRREAQQLTQHEVLPGRGQRPRVGVELAPRLAHPLP